MAGHRRQGARHRLLECLVVSEPGLTLTAAAGATGLHRRTLRRRLDGGDFPNAYRDPHGQWLVPITDLLGAGLTVTAPTVEPSSPSDSPAVDGALLRQSTHTPPSGQTVSLVHAVELEADQLRVALAEAERRAAEAEHRAELAELAAAERAATIDLLSVALRALPAGTPPEPSPTGDPRVTPTTEPSSTPTPRRWWDRRHILRR